MFKFILTLRKKILPNPKNESNFITTILKNQIIRKNSVGSIKSAAINTNFISLSLHLSKWLALYVIIMIICSCFLLFGFFQNLPFGLLQNDPDICRAFSFFTAYVCIKIFTSWCKIIGLGGPPKKKIKSPKLKNKFFSSKRKKLKKNIKPKFNNNPRSLFEVDSSILQSKLSIESEVPGSEISLDDSILTPSLGRGLQSKNELLHLPFTTYHEHKFSLINIENSSSISRPVRRKESFTKEYSSNKFLDQNIKE
eukprot:snap_masked-scaffold_19-processed-gene-5.22-mRNA-1 protein AED:1.00 eAED:1.00 QI:0/0/0/0/1/1/2/0/252